MPAKNSITRRSFLGKAAGAAAAALAVAKAPTIVPAAAIGRGGRLAPSERITMCFVGIGNQSSGHVGSYVRNRDVQILALCDVKKTVRDRFKRIIEEEYGRNTTAGTYSGCDTYNDFREMFARPDIDATLIGVPEHWHAIIAIEAARNGKDIYCEKPLSHTIREARAMVNAARRYNRVFQVGSQQRSEGGFRIACELARNSKIGKVHTVYVNVGGTSNEAYLPEEPIPDGLDWNMWLGPAVWSPYNSTRCSGDYSGGWRLIRDYSGGMMCDWGAHHFDIAQWGLGMDNSGPVEIYPPDGKDHPVLTYKYANGVTLYHYNGPGISQLNPPTGRGVKGILFVGDNGWVEVDRGYLKTFPESLAREPLSAQDVHLYRSRGHNEDWIQAIRNRTKPICDVEVGARTITVCHMGNLAFWLKRPLKWDPVAEEFIGDAEANRWLDQPKRDPWRL